ncbi:hypothetical protein IWQ62_005557 [Dispira parvispora]|uniref:ABC transporter domain-containing protein n=1 Tax=Dispira parvispora TaxID=1520584 RepID=A0A9W8AQ79_9FUNG|nr:hypothetical protein IWQ62_005557 [Dispira parvispora]
MEHLTGYENLEFYFNLRGLVVKNDCQKSTGEVRKQYIHEFLAKVRLLDFADQPVSTYSGGMKRRLAIAIALMGDPWLVLLDEPTTGMDVYSLQYIWEFIQERKADHRAIVLTTHGMEEADVLSDRLAIMNRGELSAYGSPLYLKSQLGSGYTLALTKDTEQESGKRLELLHELICSYVPNASIAKDSEQDLVYKLPIESNAPVLSRLFNELEDSIPDANLGISAVGLSMTSLEDVFLRLHSDD